jgi:hypothetical protein
MKDEAVDRHRFDHGQAYKERTRQCAYRFHLANVPGVASQSLIRTNSLVTWKAWR